MQDTVNPAFQMAEHVTTLQLEKSSRRKGALNRNWKLAGKEAVKYPLRLRSLSDHHLAERQAQPLLAVSKQKGFLKKRNRYWPTGNDC